jgi:hypothetical protein
VRKEHYKGNMDFIAGIGAVKASLELGRILSDRLNRPDIEVADVRSKIHEMLIHMVNAQMALGEAYVENSELRRQLDERDEHRRLAEDMEFSIDGAFYVRKSDANKGLIPYCPMCWKDNDKAVPMQGLGRPGSFRCNIHKVVFKTQQCLTEQAREVREQAARSRHSEDGSFWGR